MQQAASTMTSLISRFVSSVKRKGVLSTLSVAKRRAIICASERFDRSFDFISDLVNGTETVGIVEAQDLAVTSVHKDRAIRYQPTRSRPFRKLMHDLRLPSGQVFVDIGSGKGRVLMMASGFNFKKIVGVEFAQELCDLARRNLSVDRRRAGHQTTVVIHCCDAAEYRFREDETVIYMCNPFDSVVLGKVLQHLADSLRHVPRKAWLIYGYPRYFIGPTNLQSIVESQGTFATIGEYHYADSEFLVFTHQPR